MPLLFGCFDGDNFKAKEGVVDPKAKGEVREGEGGGLLAREDEGAEKVELGGVDEDGGLVKREGVGAETGMPDREGELN